MDFLNRFVSVLVSFSLIFASPGMAALIDDVSLALGIRAATPEDFASERRDRLTQILTGDGVYIIDDPSPFIADAPVTVIPLEGQDKKLEVRRFDRYVEPNLFSGYALTRTFEACLWGIEPEPTDIWFAINNGAVYGLEVRLLGAEDMPLTETGAGAGGAFLENATVSRAFVNSLLFKPQDALGENFRVSSTGILSSGRAFEDVNPQSVITLTHGAHAGKHKVITRNALYLRPDLLDRSINGDVRERIMGLTPELLISQWLLRLSEEDKRIQNIQALEGDCLLMELQPLQAQEIGAGQEGALQALNVLPDGGFPIHLRKGSVEGLRQSLYTLKNFMDRSPHATHRDMLREMDMIVSLFYQHPDALNGGIVEDKIGDVQPFEGLPATVNDLLPHYDQGMQSHKLLSVSKAFDHFLEGFFWHTLNVGVPNLAILNTVADWFCDKEPEQRQITESGWDGLRRLLGNPEASLNSLMFARNIGFDLYRKFDEKTLLDEALEVVRGRTDRRLKDRICNILIFSDENITQDGQKTTPLDVLVNVRSYLDDPETLLANLVEIGHGKKLVNSQGLVEWYVQQKPLQDPNSDFMNSLRTLAKRNQKFSWEVVLEDVFPKLKRTKEDILPPIVKNTKQLNLRRVLFSFSYFSA
jgi:hypothetical protein